MLYVFFAFFFAGPDLLLLPASEPHHLTTVHAKKTVGIVFAATALSVPVPIMPRIRRRAPAPSRPMLGAIVSVSRNRWLPTIALEHMRALVPLPADADLHLPKKDAPNAQNRPCYTHDPIREPTRATATP